MCRKRSHWNQKFSCCFLVCTYILVCVCVCVCIYIYIICTYIYYIYIPWVFRMKVTSRVSNL
jgi:hypothetical protein